MEIIIPSLSSINEAAQQFFAQMGDHKVIAFYGKMGAGKTTFIKALCQILGVEDVITSPTFSLVNEYTDREGNSIFHFDFYRIKKLDEVYDMGYEDYFYGGSLCHRRHSARRSSESNHHRRSRWQPQIKVVSAHQQMWHDGNAQNKAIQDACFIKKQRARH